jgi:ABC-type transport system involved in multi-copper enzyme maturation permease subunit
MHIQSVIERELRVQARANGTFWLRVVAGGAAAAALGVALLADRRLGLFGGNGRGPWLFALMHTTICIVLSVICPLISADTFSRERREGTLGLLLLTPLRPVSIVWGKMSAHSIRAFALWLAMAPILVVPLLLGGVSRDDFLFAFSLELGVVLGCLAGATIASVLVEDSGRATALAVLLAMLVGEVFALLSFAGFGPFFVTNQPGGARPDVLLITAILGPWLLGTGLLENGFSGMLGRNPAWMRTALTTALGLVMLGSVLATWLAFWFAARHVRRFSAERVPTAQQVARRQFWLGARRNPRQKQLLRSRLQRNPVLWLYTCQPGMGLDRWGWCLVILLVWLGMATTLGIENSNWGPVVFTVPPLLVLAMAFAAAVSFRREMESGLLELLLVTPLPPAKLLKARVRSLYGAFLPSLAMSTGLSLLWLFFQDGNSASGLATLAASWSSFLLLPWIGARIAVRRVNPLAAWALTLLLAVGLPALLGRAVGRMELPQGMIDDGLAASYFLTAFVLLQSAIATACGFATVSDLTSRRFQLKFLQTKPA